MKTRPMQVAAVLTLALLVSAFVAPALAGGKQEKAFGLVVDGYEVVGNKVLVEVTNVASTPDSGYVTVTAVVDGIPVKLVQAVRVMPGSTEYVGVTFGSLVDGVIELGVGSDPNPVI